MDNLEDRLFASFFFFCLSQDWRNASRGLFYDGFNGKWKIFTQMVKNEEYNALQSIFRKIVPKGHIKLALKGYIYGSPKKGGFKKSYPYSYFQQISKFNLSQQSFFNRPFFEVFNNLKKIKGIRRTLAFDIASGAYVVAPNQLGRLEPDRIYLKQSTGPLKGYTMLLNGIREENWTRVKKLTTERLLVDPLYVEKAIEQFETYLVDQAYKRLSKVRPSIRRFEALLELEDLICNYQKPMENDKNAVNAFLEGDITPLDYGKKIIDRYY